MWFQQLVGFAEQSPEQVRLNLTLDGPRLISKVNGRSLQWGQLGIPSLAELRQRVAAVQIPRGKLRIREVVADVQDLHREPASHGALFQVASQFNLLEMSSPTVTPEYGVDAYEDDPTQGPACAIACGAGTIYRNYFAPVNGAIGQTADNQLDCLADIGKHLSTPDNRLWDMRNGYALATEAGLQWIHRQLLEMNEAQRDELRALLRVGIQANTEVTLPGTTNRVSQVYCSALPVRYSRYPAELWESFAVLVLEAAYEATLCAAVLNQLQTQNSTVYLTLLGGGAFGNREEWIISAIRRALSFFKECELDVAVVSYESPRPSVAQLLKAFSGADC